MSADTLSLSGISPFGLSAGQESPSDQIYVLTSSQLEQIISQAIARAQDPLLDRLEAAEARIQDLEDEVRGVGCREGGEAPQDGQKSQISSWQVVQDLQARIEALEETTARERAYDRQRIARLEAPKITAKVKEREEKIKRYLESRPDHRTTLETLKGNLGIKNCLLDDAIHALQADYPNAFVVERVKTGDKRKKILRMLPRY